MGNADDMPRAADRPRRGWLAKFSTWDRVDAILLALWLAVLIVYFGGLVWWDASIRTWVVLAVGAPIFLLMAFSIGVVAGQSPARHAVDRDSLLWRWLSGLGRGLRTSIGWAIGAFLGGVVGSGIATAATLAELTQPLLWVISAAAIWVAASAIWWTTVAALDMSRLSRVERVNAVRGAFPSTKDRRRGVPQFLASFSGPSAVVLLGFIGLFMILQAWTVASATLGVG
jgi:hypothetical protein